jgi:hypothetical protein
MLIPIRADGNLMPRLAGGGSLRGVLSADTIILLTNLVLLKTLRAKMDEKLKELIEDYGHAMYNLGDCSGLSSDYEKREVGKAYARLQIYLGWNKD